MISSLALVIGTSALALGVAIAATVHILNLRYKKHLKLMAEKAKHAQAAPAAREAADEARPAGKELDMHQLTNLLEELSLEMAVFDRKTVATRSLQHWKDQRKKVRGSAVRDNTLAEINRGSLMSQIPLSAFDGRAPTHPAPAQAS